MIVNCVPSSLNAYTQSAFLLVTRIQLCWSTLLEFHICFGITKPDAPQFVLRLWPAIPGLKAVEDAHRKKWKSEPRCPSPQIDIFFQFQPAIPRVDEKDHNLR